MKKHLLYLRYIVIHKWFVFLACKRRGIIWRGIIHDWSKFLPSEWFPYVESFYGRGAELRAKRKRAGSLSHEEERELDRIQVAFDHAWLLHQHRNPHHWQHWLLREDNGGVKILEMPFPLRDEMLADWEGAGRAITGRLGDSPAWYARNRSNINLARLTRAYIDDSLGYVD